MSYLFEVSGATKAETLQRVDAEMAQAVERDPALQSTQKAVEGAISALIDSMPPLDAKKEFSVTVHGGVELDDASALVRTSFSGQVIVRKKA